MIGMKATEQREARNEILNAVVGLNEVLIKHMFGPVSSISVGFDTFRRLRAQSDIGQFAIIDGRPSVIIGNVHIHEERDDGTR